MSIGGDLAADLAEVVVHGEGVADRHDQCTSRAAARAVAATTWRCGPPLSLGQALAALALLDPQQHALGIDVADLELSVLALLRLRSGKVRDTDKAS